MSPTAGANKKRIIVANGFEVPLIIVVQLRPSARPRTSAPLAPAPWSVSLSGVSMSWVSEKVASLARKFAAVKSAAVAPAGA